jgi:hypothetical protein
MRLDFTLDLDFRAGFHGRQTAPAGWRARHKAYLTPCINFWISGAITNSSTPGMTKAQKPKV